MQEHSQSTANILKHLEWAFNLEEDSQFSAALHECQSVIDLVDALPEREQAELTETLAEAYNLQGVIHEEMGHEKKALEAYQTALHIDPDFHEAAENLAALQQERSSFQPEATRWVTLATFSQPELAHIHRGRLEVEGIPAFVADENVVTANWLWSNAVGGVKLQVRAGDVEQARVILALDLDEATPDEDAGDTSQADEDERCPNCGSARIRYERYHRRRVFLVWLLLGFPLPLLRQKWVCQNCGHQWQPQS